MQNDEIVPDPIDVLVGERLRALRKSQHLSLSELGERIGVSYQQMQKYERGANRISASQLWRLSKALRTGVDRFFPDDGDDSTDADTIRDAFSIARLEPEMRQRIVGLIDAIHRGS